MTNMLGSSRVLVDSDALVGLMHQRDALHERCLQISSRLASNSTATIVPYPIVLEAATALSRDKDIKRPDLAKRLLDDYAGIGDVYDIDFHVSELVARLYDPETSKKNSPFDHYLLALAQKNGIKYVFSFDAFYAKNGLTLAEDLLP